MADQFIDLILRHTNIYKKRSAFMHFLKDSFANGKSPGSMLYFKSCKVKLDMQSKDLLLNDKSLLNSLEKMYLDFPEFV